MWFPLLLLLPGFAHQSGICGRVAPAIFHWTALSRLLLHHCISLPCDPIFWSFHRNDPILLARLKILRSTETHYFCIRAGFPPSASSSPHPTLSCAPRSQALFCCLPESWSVCSQDARQACGSNRRVDRLATVASRLLHGSHHRHHDFSAIRWFCFRQPCRFPSKWGVTACENTADGLLGFVDSCVQLVEALNDMIRDGRSMRSAICCWERCWKCEMGTKGGRVNGYDAGEWKNLRISICWWGKTT